jgi:DNA modification methylase/ParB-like chromosome segregation protein Spo0J
VEAAVAARSRARRERQSALTEIAAHLPARPRNDLAPQLNFIVAPAERLRRATRPVRRRDQTQNARIRESIKRLGICRPILVNGDFTIVEGHGIWEAAKELGIAEVPCIVIDHLDASELRLLSLAVNRIAETGEWDYDALQAEFEDLTALGEDVVLAGFEMAEIDALLLDEEVEAGDAEREVVPGLGSAAISCADDLWLLGEQDLLQSDARDPAAYAQILDEGELSRLVLTDEPFNVPNVGHVTNSGHHREFAMANGEMSAEEFMAFNQAWMSAATSRLVDGGLMATFIDWRSIELVLATGRQLGLPLINLVVWAKSNGGQGSLWRSQHELLPFFKKGDAPHVNNIELGRHGRWRSSVWTYPGASSLGSDARDGLAHHPTVKPRALLEDALLDVTNRGDIVLEPFAGSGSTLLAADAVGRVCRAIEIDALYCDLTIERWQQMTGQEARLSETGETFAQVRARRLGEARAQTASDANDADSMREEKGDDEQARSL